MTETAEYKNKLDHCIAQDHPEAVQARWRPTMHINCP
ncbi:hypothetical protein PSE_4331 [Pseudovibrio sp. FO-BEG1]|nr:hypothetical protein PSE_4331 [Pseudovibrio sp. FO-BEG1]